MSTAHFLFKCRRCKETYDNAATAESNGQVVLLAAIWNDPLVLPGPLRVQSPKLFDVHYCGTDGMGVADLIGYDVRDK